MDEANTSTDAVDTTVETPESDPVLDILTATDDDSADQKPAEPVEETAEESEPDDETQPEGEPSEEEAEDLQAEVDPKEEARRRYEARQAVIREREQRVQQQTQEYVSQGDDEYDQRLRQMEADNYSRTIEHTENTLISEFERAKANPDLQIFNPENKEQFNEKAYDKAMRDYNAGYVAYDSNGNMVGVKGSLYEHLTETADLLQGAIKSGAVQQVRASKKMQTHADSKPSAAPKETVKDPILEILLADD